MFLAQGVGRSGRTAAGEWSLELGVSACLRIQGLARTGLAAGWGGQQYGRVYEQPTRIIYKESDTVIVIK